MFVFGKKSFIYFNLKFMMLDVEGVYLLLEFLVEQVFDLLLDYVGGMEMGGVLFVVLVSSGMYC